jgi:hypothetical protein
MTPIWDERPSLSLDSLIPRGTGTTRVIDEPDNDTPRSASRELGIVLRSTRIRRLALVLATMIVSAGSMVGIASATPCVDEPCSIVGPGGIVDPGDPPSGSHPESFATLSPTGANSFAAVGGSTGWLPSENYTLNFDVYVDNVSVIHFSRSCNGGDACLTPNYTRNCGNPLTFHDVYARTWAYNSKHGAGADAELICN